MNYTGKASNYTLVKHHLRNKTPNNYIYKHHNGQTMNFTNYRHQNGSYENPALSINTDNKKFSKIIKRKIK